MAPVQGAGPQHSNLGVPFDLCTPLTQNNRIDVVIHMGRQHVFTAQPGHRPIPYM